MDSDTVSALQLIPSGSQKYQRLYTYLPISYWLPRYEFKANLMDDIIAGLTAGIMVIPQGMGYALIASLEPIYGLYGSMFGPLIYSLFGTSGQLSVAPVAIVSLMTGEAIEAMTHDIEFTSESEQISTYIAIGSCIAFQVGILQIFIGLLQGGLIANLLSHSVILGFTCAASILIGLSQIKHIFGIDIARGEFVEMLIEFGKNIPNTHWQSLIMSLCCFIFLFLLKLWKKSSNSKIPKFIPGPLIVIIICTFIVFITDNQSEFKIIGPIENGLPSFSNFFDVIPTIDIFWDLWSASLMITLIAFIESYAVAMKYAEKRNYHISASQELIALGAPNLIGCWFSIYPVTGGLSRTAVVDTANGKTPLNSLITGIFMIIALLWFLFLFEYLPKCVLGAIIMVSVTNLFDYKGMSRLYRIKRKDFVVMMVTFIVTLFFGVEIGVGIGVICSFFMFVQRATMPHYAVLGRLEFDEKDEDGKVVVYRNIKNYQNAIIREDILIFRWDASLFFGNMFVFKSKVNIEILTKREEKEGEFCLMLCFSGINDIDATAAEDLCAYIHDLIAKYDDLTICITNMKKPIRLVLDQTHFSELISENQMFFELHEAEQWWDITRKQKPKKDDDSAEMALLVNNEDT